ncbi:hypothetical protein V6N11_053769 [Hibiscus sabdariffa]|uniref:Uncharacterized protein n=1 Tax=Hibiscus sabdariffa TaxID=183260 RepID=A0ABR2S223_9ROSI
MFQIDTLQLDSTVFENMLNLRYINFYFSSFTGKYRDKKLYADQVDGVSLPDELRLLCWEHYPFKSISSFNPKNLVVLKLHHGDMEQLWTDDHQIPNLSRAKNLEILCFNGCKSLVELPCLDHLASLTTLQLHGCYNVKKFPEVPNDLCLLNLTQTGIEEVPDSVHKLELLEILCLSKSSVKNVSKNISKLESLRFLDLSHCLIAEFPEIPRKLRDAVPVLQEGRLQMKEPRVLPEAVPQSYRPLTEVGSGLKASSSQKLPSNVTRSDSGWFGSLRYLKMNHCKSLKLLSELPRYLRYLNAHGCASLEEVSFTSLKVPDLNDYPHPFDGQQEAFIIFSNCFRLTPRSIYNIEERVMSRVRSFAKKCASGPKKLICCLPENEISASVFEYQRMNASLILYIKPPRWCFGRRFFLVFAICLVADLTYCQIYGDLEFICEFHLTLAGGGYEKFRSEWCYMLDYMSEPEYEGDHKFLLFSSDMVKEGKHYEAASFRFYIKNRYYSGEDDDIKVKKCDRYVYSEEYLMLFFECLSLNQVSIDNIEANAMLKIGFLAKKWIARRKYAYDRGRLVCCFPGDKISANMFKFRINNSRLNLKIAPNECSSCRFLAFAIYLVVDLTQRCHRRVSFKFICDYQLTSAGGDGSEMLHSEFYDELSELGPRYIGDHALILFNNDMIHEDKNYEEASFEFYINEIYVDQ